MKHETLGTKQSVLHSGDPAGMRRMLRRDLTLRNEEKLPDLKTANNMAEQLEILESYIAKAPVVDAHVRNTIRNAIANGNYTIDPVSIASKFLKFEKDLFE